MSRCEPWAMACCLPPPPHLGFIRHQSGREEKNCEPRWNESTRKERKRILTLVLLNAGTLLASNPTCVHMFEIPSLASKYHQAWQWRMGACWAPLVSVTSSGLDQSLTLSRNRPGLWTRGIRGQRGSAVLQASHQSRHNLQAKCLQHQPAWVDKIIS